MAAGLAMTPFDLNDHAARLLFEVLAGSTAFYAVDVLLIAAILARWSREPFLPLLRSAAFTTAATFAIMPVTRRARRLRTCRSAAPAGGDTPFRRPGA